MIWIWMLLIIPLVTAIGTWLIPKQKLAEYLHLFSAFILLLSGTIVLLNVVLTEPILMFRDYIYIDSLSALLIFVLVLVVLVASIYSVGYFRFELKEGLITLKQFHQFYLWFHLFIFTMISVMMLNNIALIWIAIELTTLVSALLIAFYRKRESLEAAWKYLIIGSLGIAFALFGILFLYAAGIDVLGNTYEVLNWTVLFEIAQQLDPVWVTVAFIFILVGYGTKAGLAPLHFWLPDAHSEAPSPVSAVLSGVLLNTALYGMLRIYIIANMALGGTANKWLLGFGILSIGLMVPFIIVQHDLKRMLAYSSVEHIGIISFGIGIGGPLGLYGAMLHMMNHSMVKSLLFMTAGNINQKYRSKKISRITGVLKVMPITGVALILGVLAIAGTPPFNIFMSELTVMLAGFKQGYIKLTIFYVIFILLIFAGMTHYMSKMAFGQPEGQIEQKAINRWSKVALFLPLASILLLGLYVPTFIDQTLQNVISLFEGVKMR